MTYAIRTETKGDTFYASISIALDWRMTLALVVDPIAARATYPDEATATKWADRAARIDPSLSYEVVVVA